MRIEVSSRFSRRQVTMSTRAFGKLLHLARANGWQPEKEAPNYPAGAWDTAIFLPNIGPYLTGSVSNTDAQALRRALNRAQATGEIALDRTLVFPAMGLSDVACQGEFEVRFDAEETRRTREFAELATA